MNRGVKYGLIGCGALVVLVLLAGISAGILVLYLGTQQPESPVEKDRGEVRQEGAKTNPPSQEEKAGSALIVRVSGTEGVEYSGSYASTQGVRTVNGTVGTTPEEYEVGGQTGRASSDVLTATFWKRSPGSGALRVEIVSGDEVVASQETTAEFGVASATYSPHMK